MTKIMTLLLIMENLKSGKINLNDEVLISNNAASMGGSQVFLDPNTKIKLEELLKAIVVASANDKSMAIRTLVVYFFISNESISILENWASLGLPLPKKLFEVFEKLKDE